MASMPSAKILTFAPCFSASDRYATEIVIAIRMIGMIALVLKLPTTLVGKKLTTTWPNSWTWAWIVSAGTAPSLASVPSPGRKMKPSASARMTASALLNSNQNVERRPMLLSFSSVPSDVIADTIATNTNGATVASSTLR